MPGRKERGPTALSPLRTVALAIGFACALGASVLLFLTDNPQYLRIGILVALWGFVFAALAAGRRQTEQAMASSGEIELRKTYELELEREVAARREYELRLETQLRRELQDNFASQVGDLREEMIRLRHELSEQWDSELRVERMVMRTQSVRMGNDRREALEQDAAGPTSIDAVALAPAPAQPATSSAEPSRWEPARPEPDDEPGRQEFPAVVLSSPSAPRSAPLPPPPPPKPAAAAAYRSADTMRPTPPASVPPRPTVSTPAPSAFEPDSEDVLARVLAEAGSSTHGRRRRHRYADEDDDISASR